MADAAKRPASGKRPGSPEKPYKRPPDSGIHILTIHAIPPVSMIWNPALVERLDPDKIRRWFITGSLAGWSRREVHEFTHLCCIAHHGPVKAAADASLRDIHGHYGQIEHHSDEYHEALDDFHAHVTGLEIRSTTEVLLHQLALDFVKQRARAKHWIFPDSVPKKFEKQVAVLVGDAPPPKHHHHHYKHKHHHHHHHHHKDKEKEKDAGGGDAAEAAA